jgi:hypothetical protein
MPIPSLRERAEAGSREVIRRLYIEKYFWRKSFEFEWVSYDSIRSVWTCTVFSIDSGRLSCSCGENEILSYKMSVGIIQTCVACGKSSGPISLDDRAFTPISVSRVSKAEALKKIRENNQIPPIGADHRVQVQTRYQGWRGLDE